MALFTSFFYDSVRFRSVIKVRLFSFAIFTVFLALKDDDSDINVLRRNALIVVIEGSQTKIIVKQSKGQRLIVSR